MSKARSFSKLINKDNYATYRGSDSVSDISAVSLPQGTLNFRNKIINGDMRIDQRNAGSSASFTSAGYSLDRWVGAITVGSGHTIQKSSTAPVGQSTSALITVGTGASPALGNVNRLYQVVEGYNIADLNWGTASAATVTLSFWVRSSVTGTFSGALYGASTIQSYPFTYTISSANTFEQKTVTISGPTTGTWDSTNNAGVYVNFDLGSGDNFKTTAGAWISGTFIGVTGATNLCETSGATFYITGVQLEEGTVATPFEHRPYGLELSLCQRYYAIVSSSARGSTGSWLGMHFTFPVTMRAAPSIPLSNYSNGSTNNISSVDAFYGSTIYGVGLSLNPSVTADAFNFGATAAASAEL